MFKLIAPHLRTCDVTTFLCAEILQGLDLSDPFLESNSKLHKRKIFNGHLTIFLNLNEILILIVCFYYFLLFVKLNRVFVALI